MSSLLERARTALAGQFEVTRELGRGGMGAVMLARDVELDRLVAIKVLPPELAAHTELRERFLRETRTAASFSHPNIVSIYDVEQVDGLFCLIMQYVEGETLTQRVRRAGPLSAPEAVRLFEETGWALAYAHGRGVVHRDIKPDNILIDRATGRALVTDFGVARTETAPDGLTRIGEVVGTPQFMSPEQAAGEALDGRSDLYALGVVGFFALTGRLPFEAPTTQALLAMHLTRPPPPVGSLRTDIPHDLCAVVDRCLAKAPEARFAGGEALVTAVEALRIAQPAVAPAVRNFHQQANQGVRMALFLAFLGLGVIPGGGGGDQIIWSAFLLAGIWGLLQSFYHRARFLLRQGFSFPDVRDGFRVIAEEGAAARQQLRNSENDILRHRSRMRVAVVTGLLGVAMGMVASVFLRTRSPTTGNYSTTTIGLLTVVAAAIMISLALVSFLTDPVREPRLERLTAWIWRSAFGQTFFRLAGRGVNGAATGSGARSARPDALSMPTIASGLISGLPTRLRRRMEQTRKRVAALEHDAADLHRRERNLEGALAEATTTISGDPALLADRRAGIVAEMEAAKSGAATDRAAILQRLEGVRLQLIRLRSGLGTPEEVEAELP
ncbi:MAG: serine/threonine-protein kinase [Gemmatimonadota bacterium]|nr:serine/threonine-protein kinase [Gemmatimonadota bacterium]